MVHYKIKYCLINDKSVPGFEGKTEREVLIICNVL